MTALFSFLTAAATSVVLSVTTILGGTPATLPSPQLLATPSASIQATLYKAEGTYKYLGQGVNYSVSFPIQGGKVSGSFNGVCEGNITGDSDGHSINGQIKGTCHSFFYSGDINVPFQGDINPSSKELSVKVLDHTAVASLATY